MHLIVYFSLLISICFSSADTLKNITTDSSHRQEIGEDCDSALLCTIPNSECVKVNNSTTGICECDINSYFNARLINCLKYAIKIGDLCEEAKQCRGLGDPDLHECMLINSDAENKSCQCIRDSIASSKEDKCLPFKKREERCEESQQCTDDNHSCIMHSTSGEQLCLCSEGFIWAKADYFNETSCLKIVDVYKENCTSTTQCSEGALGKHTTCNPRLNCSDTDCLYLGGYCTCDNFAYYDEEDKRCYYIGELGDPCEHNRDCGSFHSECSRATQTCECHPDAIPYELFGSRACYTNNLIGETCKNLFDCVVDNSQCVNGTCMCYSDYFPSTNNQTCIYKPYRFGDVCLSTEQCKSKMNHTQCSSGRCTCELGYYNHPNFNSIPCIPNPTSLYDICREFNQCKMDHGFCSNDWRCTCFPGYIVSSDNKACVANSIETTTAASQGVSTQSDYLLGFLLMFLLNLVLSNERLFLIAILF